MRNKKNLLGGVLLLGLMGVTLFVLLREQPISRLTQVLEELKPGWLAVGLGLMFLFVASEALCTRQILPRLGHRTCMRACLGYSFVGFYFSSITPSATGGQPAQIYYMSRDGVPAAHGALNMMLIAVCYQVVVLLYAGAVVLFRPVLLEQMGGGLGILLLFGACVNLALTAGMLCLMFIPNAARRLCGWVLTLLLKLRIVRQEEAAREKLEGQLAEYRRGAECFKRNPGLVLRLLMCTAIQLTALFAVPFAVYRAFGLTGYGAAELIGTQALLTLAVSSLPLPGAVGASEGGFVQAFTLFFGAGLVTPAVLVSRGISFYAFLLISGGVTLAVHLSHRKRASEQAPHPKCAGREEGPIAA